MKKKGRERGRERGNKEMNRERTMHKCREDSEGQKREKEPAPLW